MEWINPCLILILLPGYCDSSIHPTLKILDSNADNLYLLTVQVSDGANIVTHDLNVSVVNSNEPPVLEIMPTSSIAGSSVVLEANLTEFTGGAQPTVILQYDDEANYTSIVLFDLTPLLWQVSSRFGWMQMIPPRSFIWMAMSVSGETGVETIRIFFRIRTIQNQKPVYLRTTV